MATAAIVITNTSFQGTSQQALDVSVTSQDTVPPIFVQTAFAINLTRNRNLVDTDIKAACRQIVLDAGGPSIADNDIYIF